MLGLESGGRHLLPPGWLPRSLPGRACVGYCILLRNGHGGSEGEVTAVEEATAVQGASAVALEWAKRNAVGVAEERMRAAFL